MIVDFADFDFHEGLLFMALGLPLYTTSIIQAKQTNIIMPTTMADETEQQLREKIAPQKGSIADLPTLRSIARETGLVSSARVQLIEYLSGDEEKLELLRESKRVDAVVRLQDELHPPEDSQDCPTSNMSREN